MTAAALLEQQGIAVSIWKVNEISSRTESTLQTSLEQLVRDRCFGGRGAEWLVFRSGLPRC